MSTVKQKYIKDESNNIISPITSIDSIYDNNDIALSKWDSENGYLSSLTGYYIFPNKKLVIQWGQQSFETDNNWLQEGSDYYKDVVLYRTLLGGQCFSNFSYSAGVDDCGATLMQKNSSVNFNYIRLRTHIAPMSAKDNVKICWFVIGVLS